MKAQVLRSLWLGLGCTLMQCALWWCSGCGVGPGYLLSGLVIEDFLDQRSRPDDGIDCFDLNANAECDEDEDVNGDGVCDALDCRGTDGTDGNAGESGAQGVPGIPGPQGEPGETTVIIVDDDDEDEDGAGAPPFGHAYGHDQPPGGKP